MCNSLQHPHLFKFKKLEESQLQVRTLQRENSIVLQAKVIAESKLGIYKEDASNANARMEAMASKLRESKSDIENLKLGKSLW